jgi:putative endopeptidase
LPLLPEFKKIDSISNYSDLAAYFGRANQAGNNSPFNRVEDPKDPLNTCYTLGKVD